LFVRFSIAISSSLRATKLFVIFFLEKYLLNTSLPTMHATSSSKVAYKSYLSFASIQTMTGTEFVCAG
jgi:hypothetical protein